MKALFIADLHLCAERPETVRAFLGFVSFITEPAHQARALYILGDLFEYWAGDDDDSALAKCVAEALASLSELGTSVYFLAGNRDFLIGDAYARRARLIRLTDPARIDLDGQDVLLTHGDTLCTDDTTYQNYRRQVRDSAWQQAFLAKPLAERKQFIEALRHKSKLSKASMTPRIMDVNPDAVAQLLRSHDYPVLIHGHTHRPARHLHLVDGHHCERWVLSDWDEDAPYLLWDQGCLEPRRLHPQPPG